MEFGINTKFPSVIDNELSAVDVWSSDIIHQNINVLHNARQNYITAESSEKISRALGHNIQAYVYVAYIPMLMKFIHTRNVTRCSGCWGDLRH